MMLAVQGIDAFIERTQILRGVSLSLERGQMVGLVGRNGAGKTTLMRTIMGALKPAAGTVTIAGKDETTAPAHERARLGVGYMPEDRRLVPELNVEENIMVPAWATGIADAADRLKRVFELLPEIARFADRKALALSGGQQKLVALGRALMVGRQLDPARRAVRGHRAGAGAAAGRGAARDQGRRAGCRSSCPSPITRTRPG